LHFSDKTNTKNNLKFILSDSAATTSFIQIPYSKDTMESTPEYNLPPQELTFDGFLFDMDGTIIDSTEAVVKHWET